MKTKTGMVKIEKTMAVAKNQTAGTRGRAPRTPSSSRRRRGCARCAPRNALMREIPPKSAKEGRMNETSGKAGPPNRLTPTRNARKRGNRKGEALVPGASSPDAARSIFGLKRGLLPTGEGLRNADRPGITVSSPRNLFPRSLGKPISPKSGTRAALQRGCRVLAFHLDEGVRGRRPCGVRYRPSGSAPRAI